MYVPSGTKDVSHVSAADQARAACVPGWPGAVPIVKAAAGPAIRHSTDPRPEPLCASTWKRTRPASGSAMAGRLLATVGLDEAASHVACTAVETTPTKPLAATAATS